MSNPNTNTTPKQNNDDVIDVEQLQRNAEDCTQTLNHFLSCARNPAQKLGQRVSLQDDKHYGRNIQFLEQLGYIRNSDDDCWEFKEKVSCPFKKDPGERVELKEHDKEFRQKMIWLEQNGYLRHPDQFIWELEQQDQDKEVNQQNQVLSQVADKLLVLSRKSATAALVVAVGIAGIVFDSI